MKKTYKQNDKIPVKSYLRADPHTQIYSIYDNNGNENNLVTEEMFWGNSLSESLYLDYTKINGRSITISEGIVYNETSQTRVNEYCDKWLSENLYNVSTNKLYVVQGYAGCGKTTLMRHILKSNDVLANTCYIDIGDKWRYEREPSIFFTETVAVFSHQVRDIFKNGKLWEQFVKLCTDDNISKFDSRISSIVSGLNRIVEHSKFLNSEYNRKQKRLEENKTIADITAYLHEHLDVQQKETNGTEKQKERQQNKGQVSVVVALMILFNAAKFILQKKDDSTYLIMYDNLDVITNPAISSEMVLSLWTIINRYDEYIKKKIFDNDDVFMPTVGIYITVRKVLYSQITTYLPRLEQNLGLNYSMAKLCDVSGLYLSKNVLEYRIDYWLNKGLDSTTKNKLDQLRKITPVLEKRNEIGFDDEYYLPKAALDLDGLFNHNFRACVNILSEIIEDKKHFDDMMDVFNDGNALPWQKTAVLIFIICLIYRDLTIWNRLGFGCENFDSLDYPTTLSRVILTDLYISKLGQALFSNNINKLNIPTRNYVTLNKLVKSMKDISFIRISKRSNTEEINETYENLTEDENTDYIISVLAELCMTGDSITDPTSRGYSEDNELWRRPMYFLGGVELDYTAASEDELKQYFYEHYSNDLSDEKVKFAITDEGCVLIKDIVASFEFYSARYGKINLVKPLYLSKNVSDLNNIINPVFEAISLCCTRQITVMEQCIKNYSDGGLKGKDKINKYLNEFFHPRTNPRFENIYGEKHLASDSFRPQLHIVRVIYNHVAYFNEVKNYFAKDVNAITLCQTLTEYIRSYLELYAETFYQKLKGTICEYDNTVYKELWCLLEAQEKEYMQKSNQNIDINRRTLHKKTKREV